MKIAIQKAVGDLGEVWMIEVPIAQDVLKSRDPVAGIKGATEAAIRVADDRLLEVNMRLIEHNKLAQSLTPEALLAMRQCVQVMYGRRIVAEDQPDTTNAPRQGEGPTPPKGLGEAKRGLAEVMEAIDHGSDA